MQNSAATIQCSNPNCQASNSPDNKFCRKCLTPIVKRYLRVMGEGVEAYQTGELIGDRYLVQQQQIVLDTKPGVPPHTSKEIPNSIIPYLKLFPYRLHIPQVYEYLPSRENQSGAPIWLLEYGTVPTDNSGELNYEGLLPELTQVWQGTTALRQLNWLWQLARLWQPLQNQDVASSLLNPSLLRVNGAIIQLLELQPDNQPCSLKQLGQLWSQWAANSSPSIAEFLQQLCERLEQGQISQPEQLLDLLDRGMFDCGRSLFTRTYEIFTCTDTGPTRNHNEDACYPPSGKLVSSSGGANTLTIVCDGIGGHEGGEIASRLAIDSLREGVENLSLDSESLNPKEIALELERFTNAANDLISDRNDQEKRQDRQRMGTTVVMTLAHAHQMYLAHVGDSRIYWITPTGCHQVTVDDDLASREARLGYLLYRDAVQYPNAGALVQALGMSSSLTLHPTVERLILDEDCVFLLCSDGLSDFDRVEQYWESEILPILKGETEVTKAAERLIEIANRQNGHDNVTVALVYCQVQPIEAAEETVLSLPEIEASVVPLSSSGSTEVVEEVSSQMLTEQLPSQELPQRSWGLLLLLLVLALGGLSYLSYLLFPEVSRRVDRVIGHSSSSPVILSPALDIGETIKIQKAIALWSLPNQVPEKQEGVWQVPEWQVPEGSILQVLAKDPASPWLRLKVCHIPQTNDSPSVNLENLPLLPEGNRGWIRVEVIEQVRLPNFAPTPNQLGQCESSSSTAIPPNPTYEQQINRYPY